MFEKYYTVNMMLMRPYYDEQGRTCVLLDGVERLADDLPEAQRRQVPKTALLTKEQWAEADQRCAKAIEYRWPITRLLNKYCRAECDEPVEVPAGREASLSTNPMVHSSARPPDEDEAQTLGGDPFNGWWLPRFEACARKVGETVEKMVLGVGEPFVVKSDPEVKLFGLLNAPAKRHELRMNEDRVDKHLIRLSLDMINGLREKRFFGPYLFINSPCLDPYLDGDYMPSDACPHCGRSANGTTDIVRNRIRSIGGVVDVVRADLLHPYNSNVLPHQLIVIQPTSDVIEVVQTMPPTLVQWEDGFKFITSTNLKIKTNPNGDYGIAVAEETANV